MKRPVEVITVSRLIMDEPGGQMEHRSRHVGPGAFRSECPGLSSAGLARSLRPASCGQRGGLQGGRDAGTLSAEGLQGQGRSLGCGSGRRPPGWGPGAGCLCPSVRPDPRESWGDSCLRASPPTTTRLPPLPLQSLPGDSPRIMSKESPLLTRCAQEAALVDGSGAVAVSGELWVLPHPCCSGPTDAEPTSS